jgi:hypothetical protein
VTGIELVVGYLAAWAVRKVRRVRDRADDEVNQALDLGMDRLHQVIAGKLAADPALVKLEAEARTAGEITSRTRRRLELAVEEAEANDSLFAKSLRGVLEQVIAADQGGLLVGPGGTMAGRDIRISADHGSIAGWSVGDIRLPPERRDPSVPGPAERWPHPGLSRL